MVKAWFEPCQLMLSQLFTCNLDGVPILLQMFQAMNPFGFAALQYCRILYCMQMTRCAKVMNCGSLRQHGSDDCNYMVLQAVRCIMDPGSKLYPSSRV